MVAGNKLLRAALLSLFVLSASVWGVWDPDTDPNFIFNMDFEIRTATTTTDSVGSAEGDVEHCNDVNGPWEPEPNAMFNYSADFRNEIDTGGGDANSCRINVPESELTWDLGPDANTVYTFALWFGLHDGAGTFMGKEDPDEEYAPDFWWQFRLRDGRISMQSQYNNSNGLFMRTVDNLTSLGIVNDEWNHAAMVYDRRSRYDSKIYVNGAPVDVEIIYHNRAAAGIFGDLLIGGGEDDYDGLLDEVRVYDRVLDDEEVSLLYQWAPDNVGPYALLPLTNHTHISTLTGFEWEPIASATDQTFILGIDPNLDDPCNVIKTLSLSGSASTATNNDVNGPLAFGTDYYWRVDSNSGSIVGPVWKFTTEPGFATNPSPADGAKGVPIDVVDLSWLGSPDALTFDVYMSDNMTLVDNLDPSVQEANDIADSNMLVFGPNDLPVKGETYYWRVVTAFAADEVTGPIWSFRAASNEIVVNTSDIAYDYDDTSYPALSMTWVDTNAVVYGSLGDDDVVIFDFASDLNITDQYEIVVIPLFTTDVQEDMNTAGVRETSRPMAIHVDGDFIFNGLMDISGEVIPAVPDEDYSPYARCGGYRGPINAGGETTPREDGYTQLGPDANDRFGGSPSSKYFFIPGAEALAQFGPGAGGNGPYCVGGGAGHGGFGGDCSRGYMYGDFMGGAAYGDKEVPVPFGGSAGGYGKKSTSPGGAGGGGVEIVAADDVIIGANAEILAKGGPSAENAYPGGGGSGGSVRIIADGNFVNAGVISVDGGAGGNTNDKPSKASGGGAAGRVAIWYGNTYSNTGTISAEGGPAGISTGSDYGQTLGEPGDNGTIFVSARGVNDLAKKAAAPTPKDGDKMVYISGGSGTIDLKWYSGYGSTTDQVLFGTDENPVAPHGSPVSATRGEHSVTSPTLSAGTTYYWKVVTDGAVSSDIWSFTVVDWYCDFTTYEDRPQWDAFYHTDCTITFADFAYFAQFWYERDNMEVGSEGGGIELFMDEWMTTSGRVN